MPRNGSGGYALPTGINPVITQTLITSTWANTTLADVALALTNSLAKDGQTIPTANLPMGGFRHTGVGAPALRDNYATLGYVQDGSHYRLTSVAGNNAISAVLPGGQTVLSNGMIVQLQPVATSTGPVTLNINGIGGVQIVSAVGNQLGSGDIVLGRAYMLMYNGTAFEILNGGDTASFAQAAVSGWDRPASGVYPPITQVNPTTVAIPAGTGRIVNPSTRDISGVTEVSWPAQNVVLGAVASAWNTTIGINDAGNVVQITGTALPSAYRDNIILGSVTHMNGAIDAIRTRPSIYGDVAYEAVDTAQIFFNMLLTGGQITQNVTPLHMDMASGSIFCPGANHDQINGPNILPFAAQTNFNFYPITGASGVTAAINVAPIANYDLNGAGVVAAIPGAANVVGIHRLYRMAGGTMAWLYAQQAYPDMTTALRELTYDTQNLKLPSKLQNATLIATILATKTCASLANTTDCRIIPQGGLAYTIGVAGSIGDAPVDGSSYGRRNAAWSKVVDAIVSGDGISVNSADPCKPIVSVGATFAGPKTLTSGNWNMSATSDIVYSKTNFTIRASTADGADNCSLILASGGASGIFRGASLSLFGQESGSPGQANLESNDINLGNPLFAPGTFVNIPNSDIRHTSPTGVFLFNNTDYRIVPNTADGADNAVARILGGGAVGSSRGATISVFGNENGALPGAVAIVSGSPGGTPAEIQLTGGDVRITGGRLFGSALHNNASGMAGPTNQYVGSGTYTPVATNVANISGAVSVVGCQFMRVGNVVTVSGRFSVTPTATTTSTQFRITLPIASNLSGSNQLAGAGCRFATTTGEAVNIAGDVTNDEALFSFFSSNNVSGFLTFSFTYLVA